ncbi:NAD-dependent epimerase/dehydratase family protein [Meridianimarinicoccus aquatilis]|uniref:NAD-dependent epimerase/dehydratase family protein n=1 Tax=Meridianimarinicoccus aquatilis TaxID=2552766 RepID=A0A4V3BBS1_9RHOB|nr:NAD-dependent epimerase/dehydratase family protein [Fluviibacterium aquatile]TDL88129.1 NAD-dependent epimerase/dehydratase family protein [Fluviibacterium aquatile]
MTDMLLVTGASGFLGRILVPILRRDAQVIAGLRSGTADENTRILGDLGAFPDLQTVLSGVDCVVHCAARAHVLHENSDDPLSVFMRVNCDATLHLAKQAAQADVRRFIFLSSVGVHGNQTFGTPFRADDTPAPHAAYAVSKLAAEEGLTKIARDTGLEVVIIRPPLIIGPQPVGNLRSLSNLIKKGLPLPFGLATGNRRSLVTAEVLADLIRICTDHPGAPGQPLLVADDAPYSTRQIIERLAALSGQRLRLVPVPVSVLRGALRALGRSDMAGQLFGDLEIDISATTARLGWVPPSTHSSRV